MKRIHPTKPVELWLVLFALWLTALLSMSAKADDFGGSPTMVKRVEAAVLHVLTEGVPEHDIGPCPNHKLIRKPLERRELSKAIVFAAAEHHLDPFLLVAISFREGSWRRGRKGDRRKGDLGEVSIFQIMPTTLKYAVGFDDRCTIENHRGSALCAAALLAHWTRKCKSVQGSVAMYAGGRSCRKDTKHMAWLVNDRMNLAKRLREVGE